MIDARTKLIQIESGGRPLASYLSGEAIKEVLALVEDEREQARQELLDEIEEASHGIWGVEGESLVITRKFINAKRKEDNYKGENR